MQWTWYGGLRPDYSLGLVRLTVFGSKGGLAAGYFGHGLLAWLCIWWRLAGLLAQYGWSGTTPLDTTLGIACGRKVIHHIYRLVVYGFMQSNGCLTGLSSQGH